MRRTVVFIALVLCVAAFAVRAASSRQIAAATTRARETVHDRLQRDLDALFTHPDVEHAQWGVSVASLRTSEVLYRLNRSRLLLPASTQKLLTAAVAAERLGWDYRFTTRILATGAIGADGTLDGNLVVVSNGDPTINPRHGTRWNAFDAWASALHARGLRVVGGHLVGDDNAFGEPGWGTGWAWDDLQHGYSAPASGLQYNENQIEALIGPGMAPGSPAIIGTSPIGSGVVLVNRVVTADSGAETRIEISRLPGSPALEIRGQVPAGARPMTAVAAIDNPTRMYLNALVESLGRYGIVVAGSARDIDDLPDRLDMEGATELLVDRSAALSEIIDVTLKWSRNVYAETLLLALSPAGETAGATHGLAVMGKTLEAWGVLPDVLARDGSGLSRYDYVTADALTTVLRRMWNDTRHADWFRSALPVAGVSGTLANRLKGTPAEGRVLAKTGTMSSVRALAGYATTVDGEPLVFSILVNNYRLPAAEIDAIIDKAVLRLVAGRR